MKCLLLATILFIVHQGHGAPLKMKDLEKALAGFLGLKQATGEPEVATPPPPTIVAKAHNGLLEKLLKQLKQEVTTPGYKQATDKTFDKEIEKDLLKLLMKELKQYPTTPGPKFNVDTDAPTAKSFEHGVDKDLINLLLKELKQGTTPATYDTAAPTGKAFENGLDVKLMDLLNKAIRQFETVEPTGATAKMVGGVKQYSTQPPIVTGKSNFKKELKELLGAWN